MSVLAVNPWTWHPHPEVWVLMVGIIWLYRWSLRTIGPKVVPAGEPAATRSQQRWFFTGVALMWIAADYPIHDIGEKYLYTVHMLQHLLLSLVVPPMLLLGIPTWLARLIVGEGRVGPWIRWICRPVTAALIFNAFVLFTHWPALVDTSVRIGWMHFLLHTVLVVTALAAWVPVCGPIPEWRLGDAGRMVYLFMLSVVPTLPAAWLTFSSHPIYKVYVRPYRMWGISALSDQQAAGLFMKLGEAAYLWALIAVLFFRWAGRDEAAQKAARAADTRERLAAAAAARAPGRG